MLFVFYRLCNVNIFEYFIGYMKYLFLILYENNFYIFLCIIFMEEYI